MTLPQLERDRLASLRERLDRQPQVTIDLADRSLVLTSRHGLFSARALDDGTAMLLRELQSLTPPTRSARVLDLGCGYGAIGVSLAQQWLHTEFVMVDVDIRAIEASRQNVSELALTNVQVCLSDGVREVRDQAPFDLVVSNLPAQAGNDALDELLLGAYDVLAEGGLLVVVAVNGLRAFLQRRLADIFAKRNVSKVRQGSRHTILQAARVSA